MEYQQRLSFNRVGWERLSTRRKYFKLIMLHKMQNGLAPQYLSNMSLPLVSNIQSYPLRNAQRIRPPRTRTTRYERSFLPSAIQLWNSLPIELILMNSQIHFKKALNAHLFPQKVPPYWSYGERWVSIYTIRGYAFDIVISMLILSLMVLVRVVLANAGITLRTPSTTFLTAQDMPPYALNSWHLLMTLLLVLIRSHSRLLTALVLCLSYYCMVHIPYLELIMNDYLKLYIYILKCQIAFLN